MKRGPHNYEEIYCNHCPNGSVVDPADEVLVFWFRNQPSEQVGEVSTSQNEEVVEFFHKAA